MKRPKRPNGCTCWDGIDRFRAELEGITLDDRPCAKHHPNERADALEVEQAEDVRSFNRRVLDSLAALNEPDDAEPIAEPIALLARRAFADVPLNAPLSAYSSLSGFTPAEGGGTFDGPDAA